MFWGQHLKKGTPYKLDQHTASSLLHVSNVALASEPKNSGKTHVWAQAEGKKVLLTTLESGKYEHASLDLYFRVEQEVQFYVEGTGEIFIAGYYEPETDNEFGDFDEEGSSEEEANGHFKALTNKAKKSTDASSEEEKPQVKTQPQKGQPGKPAQQPQAQGKPVQAQAPQGGKPVPAQQGGKPQQPAQQQPQKPGQPQPGQKPGQPQQGQKPGQPQGQKQPPVAAKKPELDSDDLDELDDEIDDEIGLDDEDDDDDGDDDEDIDLDEDDDDEDDDEINLGKRKSSKDAAEGDNVRKQQKNNAGIPVVKQELKGQQGGKPQQHQGGKGGQQHQGGKPHHQGGQHQGGKGTPQGQQHKGPQQHSSGKPGQQNSGGKGGQQHQGGKKNKKQH